MHAIFHMLLSPWISSNRDIRPLSRGYLQVRKNSTLTLQLAWALPAYATCQPKGNALSILRIPLGKAAERHDCSREPGSACYRWKPPALLHRHSHPRTAPPAKIFWKEGGRGRTTSNKKSFPPSKPLSLPTYRCLPPKTKKSPAERGQKRPPRAESCKGVSNNLWQRPTFPHDVMQYHRRWRA